MTDEGVVVLGIPIPSSSPLFLSIVAVHVVAGLICTIAGVVAMLAPKRSGRQPVGRHRLLLESAGGLSFHVRALHSPMASRYAPLRSGRPLFRHRMDRQNGEATALAGVAACAREWHGSFVHPATHGVLCGQRTEL